MALKDIFTMVKADRYTADGCEVLNKAREADVEDRTYNVGEISEKIGLQKTANGWVKPKNGKAAGEKTEKEDVKPAGSKSTAITEWEESAKKDAKAYNENMVILQNEKGETTAVRESSPDVEKAEAHGYKKMSLVRPDGSVKKHEGNAESKPAEAPKTEKKPTLKLPDEKSSFSTDVNRMKKLKKEDYKQYTIQLEKLHSKYPINKWKDLYNKTTTDSAPRVLTGDCKVRIRKA